MTYNKPEIAILGDAARVIQMVQNDKHGMSLEFSSGQYVAVSPAYDLDE